MIEEKLKNVEIVAIKECAFNKFTKMVEYLPEGSAYMGHFEKLNGKLVRELGQIGGEKPTHIMSAAAWSIIQEYYQKCRFK